MLDRRRLLRRAQSAPDQIFAYFRQLRMKIIMRGNVALDVRLAARLWQLQPMLAGHKPIDAVTLGFVRATPKTSVTVIGFRISISSIDVACSRILVNC